MTRREVQTLAASTVERLKECLNRTVNRAMARDLVKRNVVTLCGIPKGQLGRPSKSLTLDQAAALLDAAESSPIHGYIVLSLLTGARTEELRALRWEHVDLNGQPNSNPPVPPSIQVWRSVREQHQDQEVPPHPRAPRPSRPRAPHHEATTGRRQGARRLGMARHRPRLHHAAGHSPPAVDEGRPVASYTRQLLRGCMSR